MAHHVVATAILLMDVAHDGQTRSSRPPAALGQLGWLRRSRGGVSSALPPPRSRATARRAARRRRRGSWSRGRDAQGCGVRGQTPTLPPKFVGAVTLDWGVHDRDAMMYFLAATVLRLRGRQKGYALSAERRPDAGFWVAWQAARRGGGCCSADLDAAAHIAFGAPNV